MKRDKMGNTTLTTRRIQPIQSGTGILIAKTTRSTKLNMLAMESEIAKRSGRLSMYGRAYTDRMNMKEWMPSNKTGPISGDGKIGVSRSTSTTENLIPSMTSFQYLQAYSKSAYRFLARLLLARRTRRSQRSSTSHRVNLRYIGSPNLRAYQPWSTVAAAKTPASCLAPLLPLFCLSASMGKDSYLPREKSGKGSRGDE